ncbi:RNA polymerase, sigma 32 subunit, RpoH [Sulfurivirga caldicuralii]|uniref:RNA polymerase sigma factor RpoH n=1 Tax=Sulfurivirga caldicuralii TaxID=364032 RepID=A0A1N6DFN1_9GAMM|nr:RNA polymerase sigma factor RpoH [Sulfurivirga caldicuralii]SIN69493.1 RNA polymerase, sigma 32 subunit, RpoH [Sulfurivirga caldicuralii]
MSDSTQTIAQAPQGKDDTLPEVYDDAPIALSAEHKADQQTPAPQLPAQNKAELAKLERALVPGKDLNTYLKVINQFPALTPEQERELAKRWYYEKDVDAARQLVLSSLRYVVPIARSYAGYGLPLADLIQEGNIGLMKAVQRFNPEQNVRLMTFAVHWIRAEINEYIIRNWRIVKTATTKAQRKLFFKLRGTKKALEWFGDKEAERVAEELGVTKEDVLEMDSRLYGQDISVDVSSDDDENERPQLVLASHEPDPETQLAEEEEQRINTERMREALKTLDDRSRDILEQRWLSEKKTGLKELSEKYGVSMERIRQIEKAAIKKLQKAMTAA